MKAPLKNVIFWTVMAVTALLIWSVVKSSTSRPIRNLSFTEFSHEIAHDNVREVTIKASGNAGIFSVQGVLKKDNGAFKTAAPANDADWLKALTDKNVNITFDPSEPNSWQTWLTNGMPLVLILGLWIFIMRSMQKRSRQMLEPRPMSDASGRS
jgi:cell division protease FtsH